MSVNSICLPVCPSLRLSGHQTVCLSVFRTISFCNRRFSISLRLSTWLYTRHPPPEIHAPQTDTQTHTPTHAHTLIHRQTDRQTHTPRPTHGHTLIHRQTHRQTVDAECHTDIIYISSLQDNAILLDVVWFTFLFIDHHQTEQKWNMSLCLL